VGLEPIAGARAVLCVSVGGRARREVGSATATRARVGGVSAVPQRRDGGTRERDDEKEEEADFRDKGVVAAGV